MSSTTDNSQPTTQTPNLNTQDARIASLSRGYLEETPADKRFFFNFFLENNDIFQVIKPHDEDYLKELRNDYYKRTFTWTATAFVGTFLADKIMKRSASPRMQAKKYKKTAWMSKYLGVPLLSFAVCRLYFCKDEDRAFKRMSEKYSFTFDDYNRAMNILDKANSAGKLGELLNKGDCFDWDTVPGGKPSMSQPTETEK